MCALPKPERLQQQGAAHLVAAGHNNVLRLRHDIALLGYQCVLCVAREPVGGEEPIVLLHTELLPRQLAFGTVSGDRMAGEGKRQRIRIGSTNFIRQSRAQKLKLQYNGSQRV